MPRVTKTFLVVLVLLATTFSPALTAHVVSGAAFTVNSNGDSSDSNPGDGICKTTSNNCTLRAALQEADYLSGTTTITIPAMAINVNSQLVYNYYTAGNYTDGSVEIIGAGPATTIIDGQQKTRVFFLRTINGRVTIRNLTIRNGYDVRTPVTDPGNPAYIEYRGYGAGILIDGLLDLYNVAIISNTAQEGGGIYQQFGPKPADNPWHPLLRMYSVNVSYNTSTTTTFGLGGGGISNGSEIYGENVMIEGNLAHGLGGGIYNNSWNPVELHRFNLNYNVSNSDGGGILNDIGDIKLYDGLIMGNHTKTYRPNGGFPGGAGVASYGLNEGSQLIPATMAFTRVTIRDNVAEMVGAAGGGVYNFGTMTFHESSVFGNKATYGAGIYSGSPDYAGSLLNIYNTTISSNSGTGNTSVGSEGGGMMGRSGTANIYNSTISSNFADYGGGVSTRSGQVMNLYKTILATNVASKVLNDCWGNINSGDYNLIKDLAGTQGYLCSVSLKPHDKTNIDPLLGALTGIPYPMYHPIWSNSPAYNAAGTGCTPIDQRGVSRPQGGACDIGAYEYINYTTRILLPSIKR